MGNKPWHCLGLVAFAGAMIAGCNNTNPQRHGYDTQKQAYDSKGPPASPQMAGRPPVFQNNANTNQPAFPQANNPQKSPFTPTSNANTPNPFAPTPGVPQSPSPFNQNQGNPISSPSQSFTPPTFPPMNSPPSGTIPLPGREAKDTLPPNSALFPQSTGNSPVVPPSGVGNFPPR